MINHIKIVNVSLQMHAYMYISISIIPSFLFSCPLCHVVFLVLFYQLYFLFYLCTTLYIHIAQNSKGIKGDAMKSLSSTLFFSHQFLLPNSNQCYQICVSLPEILFTFFLYNCSHTLLLSESCLFT